MSSKCDEKCAHENGEKLIYFHRSFLSRTHIFIRSFVFQHNSFDTHKIAFRSIKWDNKSRKNACHTHTHNRFHYLSVCYSTQKANIKIMTFPVCIASIVLNDKRTNTNTCAALDKSSTKHKENSNSNLQRNQPLCSFAQFTVTMSNRH